MVICPDCGKEVKEAKFCSNCGALLPEIEEVVEAEVVEEPAGEVVDVSAEEETVEEEKFEVVKKSKFCTNCGTEVDLDTVFCPQCGFKFAQEEKPQTKFCQSCGKKINFNAEICPHCGVRVANVTRYEEKNVLLSAILSFLFPGLGHLYLGLNKKGVSFIIAYIVSAILIILLIGIVLVIIVWIWALIDTIKSTEAINKGEFVEDKLF
ncbi:zinc ribbon domain-containing protein [Methanobrevibacter sp.]